jgi:predicted lipoprotein with Yx(FWY)xxD motif
MRRLLLPLPLLAVVALLVAACGGGSPSVQAVSAASTRATVTATKSKLGTILTDSKHRTLYLFRKDARGMSACSGACASAWPPLLTKGHPKATGAVRAARLGTTRRSDGTTQVTYRAHPLYSYAGDQRPGDTNGQGLDQFGGLWFVVGPSGAAITR